MTTGVKIADARKKKNMTQEQMAELLGVTRQSVSRWESDTAYPETDKLIKIAELLGVNCDYLLREEISEPEGIKEKNLVTRLLQEAVGKRIKLSQYDDLDIDFLSYECRILGFDGSWANVELYKGKKTETKIIPVASICSITFVKGKE